jgi:hypothetical protein
LSWQLGFREGVLKYVADSSAKASAGRPVSKQEQERSRRDAFDRANRAVGGQFTFEEMVKALDGFYDDPANRQIPVVDAFSIMKLKSEGALPNEIERRTAIERAAAAALTK